jgi:hypothetical protein
VSDQDALKAAQREIHLRDQKLERLRNEVRALTEAARDGVHHKLREENRELRKALSYIACNPGRDPEKYERVARVALGNTP